jgi:hypothetical protein
MEIVPFVARDMLEGTNSLPSLMGLLTVVVAITTTMKKKTIAMITRTVAAWISIAVAIAIVTGHARAPVNAVTSLRAGAIAQTVARKAIVRLKNGLLR